MTMTIYLVTAPKAAKSAIATVGSVTHQFIRLTDGPPDMLSITGDFVYVHAKHPNMAEEFRHLVKTRNVYRLPKVTDTVVWLDLPTALRLQTGAP